MTIGQPVACILSGLAIGVFVEGVARALKIWTYRTPGYLAINILVMFGLVEGYGVGWVIGGRHAMGGIFPVLFMVGAEEGDPIGADEARPADGEDGGVDLVHGRELGLVHHAFT